MLGLRNGGQVEVGPATLFQQVANQVVHVQALHGDHDGVRDLIVEARASKVFEYHCLVASRTVSDAARASSMIEVRELGMRLF